MLKTEATYKNSEFLLEVIHNFVRFTSTAESSQEVFWAITKNFMHTLNFEDCVVYEALPKQGIIIQRAAHGEKNPNGETINNLLELDYGQGIVGWVAENQETVCIGDVSQDQRYVFDTLDCLSELCVPIQFNGELFGVIDSENSNKNYYTPQHVQLFELIADLAANLLIRIRQKTELEDLKQELEILLDTKKQALESAIETVSDQVNKIKKQSEKSEILIKEVHHRVNNNLQILSSLINIYLNETRDISSDTLIEIKNKIQILSSIHLILLKSVENNKSSVRDFLMDLIASIRYMNQSNYLILEATSEVNSLSLNTLVPLGLLINELIETSVGLHWKKGEAIKLELELTEQKGTFIFRILADKKIKKKTIRSLEMVNQILIEALVHQLEGQIEDPKLANCLWEISFRNID